MRDDAINSSVQQIHRVENNAQQTTQSTYTDRKPSTNSRQTEQINTMTPATSVAYPSVTNTNIINGCDPSNPVITEPISYQNSTATNYPNTLTVDTTVNYQMQPQGNYYPQVPQQQYYSSDTQQTERNNYVQPWSQQPQHPHEIPNESDILNSSSQVPSTNNSYYQPPTDQSQYIQPGFTSTPNSYSSQQPNQWCPPGQAEQRERLPSNEHQQMELITRRSSIITFNESDSLAPSNWHRQSMTDDRRASLASIQLNTSNNSPKNNSDTANFCYQPPQRLRYPTTRASISEESQAQTNGQVKKKHSIFDDSDDVFPNNSHKTSDGKPNTASPAGANQTAAGGQKSGIVGSLISRFGWKRPVQAHLPDDKNKTLKFDEKTGSWIDTAKSADDQASKQIIPPPMISASNTFSSHATNQLPSQQQQQQQQQQQ
ncbi:unnamed protein product, partial [Rotaria socialis]